MRQTHAKCTTGQASNGSKFNASNLRQTKCVKQMPNARLGKHHQSRKASRNCFAIALRFEASDAKCARSCSHIEVGSWRSQWSSKASKRCKAAIRLDTARCPCNGVRASKRTCCRACPKIDRENPALKDQWQVHGKPFSLEHGKPLSLA